MNINTAAIAGKAKESALWTVKTTAALWNRQTGRTKFLVFATISFVILLALAISWWRTNRPRMRLPIRSRIGTGATTPASAPNTWNDFSSTILPEAMSAASTATQASTSKPDQDGAGRATATAGVVIGEDSQEYILPSLFGIKRREGEQLDMDVDALELRVTFIEEMLFKRATNH